MPTVKRDLRRTLTSYYATSRPVGPVEIGTVSTSFYIPGSSVGSSNPLYKDQILKHVDATTGYTRSQCIEAKPAVHRHSASRLYSNGSASSTQYSSWLSSVANDGDDLVLKDRALSLIKRKLATSIGNVSSMAPMAELRELRGLIRGLAGTVSGKSIVQYAAARASAEKRFPLTAGRNNEALLALQKKRRKFLADAWLEVNFGLKPLMGDVADAAQAVAARLEGVQPTRRLTAFASKDWVSGGKYTVVSDALFSRTIHSVNAKHQLSYMYIAGVAPELISGNNYTVADQFGFAWKELPGVAWELTPYSWLIDYFANVGEYLSDTFECPPGYSRYLLCVKRYTCESQENPGFELYYPGACSISGDSSTPGQFRYFSLRREKIAALPHIGLHLKTSDEVGYNAVSKLLNLLSVYIQRK